MTTATPAYGSPVTMTITLASLATSATLVAGRESTAVNNVTDDAIDALVGGKVTTGTTPTANTQIEVWAYGSWDSVEFSGSAAGTDGALTPSSKTTMRLLTVIPNPVTSTAQTYKWGPYSVAQAFGGVVPSLWGVWISQNTGTTFHTTATNFEVVYTPVKFESA